MSFDKYWNARLDEMGDELQHFSAITIESMRKVAEHSWNAALESEQGDDESFRLFWQAYPRRVGKPAAERKWKRLKKSEQRAILDHLPKRKWPGNKDYIPHPSTFLNQRRWEDEDQETTVTEGSDVF